ncbi:sodium-dependent glucose transporter 1-like isoform X3 [Dermacentor variabilis]|uniref:sodium-dependent glucose transporter 1-like isoform X3 n=1 Tax=Dermacentor variabilis TaxID=34621 RepID=UPI003F5BCB5F
MTSRYKLWLDVGRTCNLSLGNLGMGIVGGILGVALLDLAEIYGTSIGNISYIITTFSVGALVGSLLGGKLHDTYNTQLVSILAMIATSVTVTIFPLGGILVLAHVTAFL